MSTADPHWVKSSYSHSTDPGDCVEVATPPATIHIRDSKTPETPHLAVSRVTWAAFLDGVS
ncbi:toxin, partial [Streptomyces sp. MMG1533]|uniref:DUF397 domain-containing protein n=1 Tax=Streptomyces sp. MMG1533 TaxID=1415546 RepID=UPI0006B0549B